MKKAMKSRVVALLLAVVLVLMMLPSALAVATSEAEITFANDENLTAAIISGTGLKVIDTVAPVTRDNVVVSQIELSPNTTAETATVTLKKADAVVDTLTVTLPTTSRSETTYATVSKVLGNTTYEFDFVVEAAYTNGTQVDNIYFETPDDEVTLGTANGASFNATTTLTGFPQNISLRIVPGGNDYDAVSAVSLEALDGNEATLEHYAGTYYVATFPANGKTLKYRISYTMSGDAVPPTDLSITLTAAQTASGNGAIAYLPAPGQFTNEGIGSGGWGDIYTQDSDGNYIVKPMVDTIATTGVSLGYFGGYAVFDFGVNEDGTGKLKDNPNNKYGVDFVVYGNAFSGNSEPGSVQVSLDGDTWYDLAGSMHYDESTQWNYKVTYVNPGVGSTPVAVPYYVGTNTSNVKTVETNTWHNHWWFPLAENYFTGRYGNTDMSGIAKGWSFVNYTPDTTVTLGGTTYENTQTLRLSGVLLGGVSSNTTAASSFGYFDCHSNTGDLTNPYATGSSTGGGDGMDLAWAVYSSGNDVGMPVSAAIQAQGFRYVRLYNGVAKDLPPFGEISPEVCGIKRNTTETTTATCTNMLEAIEEGDAAVLFDVDKAAMGIEPIDLAQLIADEDVTVLEAGRNYAVLEAARLRDLINEINEFSVQCYGCDRFAANSAVGTGNDDSYVVTGAGKDVIRLIMQSGDAEPYTLFLKLYE